MGNLGAYQAMTTLAKKVGGPKNLAAITLAVGYLAIRPAEAGVKRVVAAIRQRDTPCPTKGRTFLVTADGEYAGLAVTASDQFEVLECDGDAILIALLGREGNPYFVPAEFLSSVSSFPGESAAELP